MYWNVCALFMDIRPVKWVRNLASPQVIFQKLKITKSNHLWTSPKICGYLQYPIVLFDITFWKYGWSRKVRQRNCFYQKYDGTPDTKYVCGNRWSRWRIKYQSKNMTYNFQSHSLRWWASYTGRCFAPAFPPAHRFRLSLAPAKWRHRKMCGWEYHATG